VNKRRLSLANLQLATCHLQTSSFAFEVTVTSAEPLMEDAQTSSAQFCTQCGKKAATGDLFCAQWGKSLTATGNPPKTVAKLRRRLKQELAQIQGVGFWVALFVTLPTLSLPAVLVKVIAPGMMDAAIYFLFFLLGTVDRVLRHDDLANRRQDRQVRARSGRLAFIGGTMGLLAAHWLSLYIFSQGSTTFSL
jgi:hypothetical protein